MESSVFDILHRRMSEKRRSIVDYMASGGAQDFTEYAKLAAQHQLCLEFEDDIKELEKRFMDE